MGSSELMGSRLALRQMCDCKTWPPSSPLVGQDLELQQAKRLGFKVLVDYVAAKTPFPMGGAVTTQRYVREKRDVVLRYVKALAQAPCSI